jgi:DHA2 family multidrug resistance protein
LNFRNWQNAGKAAQYRLLAGIRGAQRQLLWGLSITFMDQSRPPPLPMERTKLALAIFVLSLATFIVILDTTIINVAVPHIAGAFAASPSEGTWVITSYAVAEALTVPVSGWLANRFGIVKVLTVSLLSFALFSALCGLASTLEMLILLRILQGLSGGPLIPISQTLIMRIAPPAKLETMMGLWMMTSIVAPVLGPMLGGILADTIGWRWAFYLNVPIAASCGIFGYFLFRDWETQVQKYAIDYVGLALLCIWVVAFQIMLDTGENHAWFQSNYIFTLLIVSITALVLFVIWEITDNYPIVDLRVLRHRGFALSSLTLFLAFGAFFASLILLPLWLQLGMGYTATTAGYVLAQQGLLGVLAAPLAAYLMKKVDSRFLMSAALMVLAAAIFSRSNFATTIGLEQFRLPQLAIGIALPFFFVPIVTTSLLFAPRTETAAASSIINFLRTLAAAIATAAVVSTWSRETITKHAALVEFQSNSGSYIRRMTQNGLSHGGALQTLDALSWQQAMVLAVNDVFIFLSLILVLTAAGIWLLPRLAPSHGPVLH